MYMKNNRQHGLFVILLVYLLDPEEFLASLFTFNAIHLI
jgi:hypothetical protein